MVKVYFQTADKSYSYLAAIFDDEQMYMACLQSLESDAESRGFIVTETIEENLDLDNLVVE